MRVNCETEAGHQAEHLAVGREYVTDHGAIALDAGTVDQRRHQLAADATFLPIVTDSQRKLN